jgi:threonine/homoserine/homoserine lactone efflux protein
MLLDSQVAAFAGVALVLTLTPGPDTFLVIRAALAGGFRRGLVATTGILSGGVVHASLAAAGLSAILLRSARLFEAVKLVGAGYLIWIGVRTILDSRRHSPASQADLGAAPADRSVHRTFLDGFLTNVLNPKVAVFYLAFLPQFIKPGDPVVAKTFLLVGIHYAMGIVWLPSVALFVDRMAATVAGPTFRKRLERTSGVILTGLGLRLALTRR